MQDNCGTDGSDALPVLGCARVHGSCLLEACQLRHLLHGVDERVQSFHLAIIADFVFSQAVQGRTDVKGKMIVGQTAL